MTSAILVCPRPEVGRFDAYLKAVVRCSSCDSAGWIGDHGLGCSQSVGERKSIPAAKVSITAAAAPVEAAWARVAEAGGIVDLAALWLNHATTTKVVGDSIPDQRPTRLQIQMLFEKVIVDCRFLTLLAVAGSLLGSVLCFAEGCFMILKSYVQYFRSVELIIEATGMFLIGTAMLMFGMGVYSMFVGCKSMNGSQPPKSNMFGLFHLKMLPPWVEMQSAAQAKTKIGHAVLMILQAGVLEKFKSVPLVTGLDLACFAASVLVSSACTFLLYKLSTPQHSLFIVSRNRRIWTCTRWIRHIMQQVL